MRFCVYSMHNWIGFTLNTNAVSHIKGVGDNCALLMCIEIVDSTDKRHFLVTILASKVLQDKIQLARLNQIEMVSKTNPFRRFVKNVIKK